MVVKSGNSVGSVIGGVQEDRIGAYLMLGQQIARRFLPMMTGTFLLGGFAQAATLTVNDTTDPGSAGDGKCTLREAIVAVNSGTLDPDCPNGSANPLGTRDNITFDPGLTGDDIKLNGNALQITADVGILGPDAGEPNGMRISAIDLSRVLEVTGSDIEVTLDSFTLRDGTTTASGGAVLLDGTGINGSALTLINSIVTENHADGNGGGMHAAYGDSLTVNQSALYENVAGVRGGGLSTAFGTLTVLNSEIESNESDGGAVYAQGNSSTPSVITISGSTIRNNPVASTNSAGGVFAIGSASSVVITDSNIRNNGGRGINTFDADLQLTGVTVSGHAQSTASGAGVFGSGGEITITDSTISGNTTTGNGGGIFVSGELTLDNSTVASNSAGGIGGGVLLNGASPMLITRSTIRGNAAGASGGGLSASDSVQVTNSTISGNTAGNRAGGVRLGDGETLDLEFSTVAGNSSTLAGSNLHIYGSGAFNVSGSLIVSGQGAANCGGPALNVMTASLTDDDTGCFGGLTENALAASRLGPLTDNGGPTLTHALFQGNPAIDAIDQAFCLDEPDQRGFFRPRNGDNMGPTDCDIGAVEFTDSDFDGVIDFYESNNGLDPNDASDPNGGGDDLDGDGVTNQDEFEGGLAADNPDSDGDFLGDGIDNQPGADSNACVQDGLGDADFDFTAMSGMITQCAAETSITVRGTAIIESGAELELYAPNVLFEANVSDQVQVPLGAQIEVHATDPTPGAAP